MGERIYDELVRADDPRDFLSKLPTQELALVWSYIKSLGPLDGVPLEMGATLMGVATERLFKDQA